MGATFTIENNEALKEFKKAIDSKIWNKAFKTTANEIAKQGFNKTKSSIIKRFNISIAALGKNHFAFKSRQTGEIKKTTGHLYIKPAYKNDNEIEINIKGDGIPLILFPHSYSIVRHNTGKIVKLTKKSKVNKQDKKLITVKISKTHNTLLKNAFIATMKSGHQGIFQRKDKSRLPIMERASVSVRHMFRNAEYNGVKGFENILQSVWVNKGEQRMLHNLNRIFK